MSNRKKRHLSPAGFVLSLAFLIVAIFITDSIVRLFWQADTENIVGVGGFSKTSSSSSEDEGETTTEDTETETETETESDVTILQLTAADQAEGNLILVDENHPYTGTTAFSDFSTITDSYVVPRLTSLPIRTEVQQSLCNMFDDYAAYNGSANLQIYSTLQSTLDSTSIYTNDLPDRDTGYSFDIGLITSTGEVVPYIQKHNEWMVSNSWEYGFILRYPSDKTNITGISYAPHHFRYVGQLHAAIMHENDFCLEEYLNFLQSYTMDSGGYSYVYDDQSYILYYIPADENNGATVELPKDSIYTVSGDNQGGYILTLTVSTETEIQARDSETTATATE